MCQLCEVNLTIAYQVIEVITAVLIFKKSYQFLETIIKGQF